VNTAPPFAFAITVDPADIDFMGHVNNASYLKWVQDAVVRSLARVCSGPGDCGPCLGRDQSQHHLPATDVFGHDPVIAHVTPERVQGARAFYETIIKRGEVVLAEVKSSLVLP